MYLVSFRCPVLLHLVSGTRFIRGQVWYLFRTRYQVLHAQSYDTWYLVDSVACQVILEPGIGQFREFEPRRVHTQINSLGLLLVLKLIRGKRKSVS